jgi:hypothetical protein
VSLGAGFDGERRTVRPDSCDIWCRALKIERAMEANLKLTSSEYFWNYAVTVFGSLYGFGEGCGMIIVKMIRIVSARIMGCPLLLEHRKSRCLGRRA